MPKTQRTTISLPKPKFEQLVGIAEHRGLLSVAALIEVWIAESIANGEIPPELPGITCQRVGSEFVVSVLDRVLPPIPANKAILLASVLSAAAGEKATELTFSMEKGQLVTVDLGGDQLVIRRAGQGGIRLIAKPKDGGDSTLASVSASFAIELARQIRAEFNKH